MKLEVERKEFTLLFSERLTHLMRTHGHASSRAKTGVNIAKLASITGCSYQMARKYALGLALPELCIVRKIAAWLNVSPSWLLFGDEGAISSPSNKTTTAIEIEPELLRYILTKSATLFAYAHDIAAMVNFIVDSIYDASQLNADTQTIHKIIDTMVASAMLTNTESKQQCKGM